MRNKKGFTLIELLVTIALMLSILGIAIVSFINVSNRKKEDAYEQVKKQAELAGEQFFDTNQYMFEGLTENGTSGLITIERLVNEDYLNVLTDPRTGRKINKCDYIKVTKTSSGYKTEYVNNNVTDCPDILNTVVIQEVGAPDISITLDGTKGDNGWYTSIVNLLVTISTKGNGLIKSVERCATKGDASCTNFINLEEVKKEYKETIDDTKLINIGYKVTNLSGKSAKRWVKLKVDTKEPECSCDSNIKPSDTGWYNKETGKPTLKFEGIDETSGISGVSVKTFNKLNIKSGIKEYTHTFKDKAGNSKTCSLKIKYDNTDPKCNVTLEGDRKNKNQSYWYTDKVTLKGKCTDTISGCEDDSVSNVFSAEGKYLNASAGIISDKAGNTKKCNYNKSFGIDKTPPATINVSNPYVCQEKNIDSLNQILENFNSNYKSCDKHFEYNNGTFEKIDANFYLYMKFNSSDKMSGLKNNESNNYKPNEGWEVGFELFNKNGKKVTGCLQKDYPCTWQQEAKVCDRAGNCTEFKREYGGLSY